MASAVAWAYNSGLGADCPVGSRGRTLVRGHGFAPWSWSTFRFWTFDGSHKFAPFLKFGNSKKSDICVIFQKIMGGHKTGGGAVPSCPRPKTARVGLHYKFKKKIFFSANWHLNNLLSWHWLYCQFRLGRRQTFQPEIFFCACVRTRCFVYL